MHDVVARALDVPGAIEAFRYLLALKAHMYWTDVVKTDAPPWQVLSALLGLLELARLGELRVAQARPFANVEISRDPDLPSPLDPDDQVDSDTASEAA
jgi:segregation and condensation protein A